MSEFAARATVHVYARSWDGCQCDLRERLTVRRARRAAVTCGVVIQVIGGVQRPELEFGVPSLAVDAVPLIMTLQPSGTCTARELIAELERFRHESHPPPGRLTRPGTRARNKGMAAEARDQFASLLPIARPGLGAHHRPVGWLLSTSWEAS